MEYGRLQTAYQCKCALCGKVERLPRGKILKRQKAGQGCTSCIRGACVICGKPVPADRPKSNTCSELCQQEKIQDAGRRHYAKKASPDFNRVRYQAQKERELNNPVLREKRVSREKITKKSYRLRPEIIARSQEYHRNRWSELKDLLTQQRREFFASLSPDEQRLRAESLRDYNREWARKFREWLFAHPEEHEKFKEKQREWVMENQRRKALAELLGQSQKLINRDNDDESSN